MIEPRINANEHERKRWDLCHEIIKVFYEVYNELGCAFLEAVYEEALARALRDAGFQAAPQVPTPIWFRGAVIGDYRADIIVNGVVLLELKASLNIDPSHKAQPLNYLRATEIEAGVLFNFGPKPQFHRFVFENERKGIRGDSRSFAASQ
jgi:GxxExxY protein